MSKHFPYALLTLQIFRIWEPLQKPWKHTQPLLITILGFIFGIHRRMCGNVVAMIYNPIYSIIKLVRRWFYRVCIILPRCLPALLYWFISHRFSSHCVGKPFNPTQPFTMAQLDGVQMSRLWGLHEATSGVYPVPDGKCSSSVQRSANPISPERYLTHTPSDFISVGTEAWYL